MSEYAVYALSFLGLVKRILYFSAMRAAKVQASLRIRAVSPEPPLLAHTGSESRGTYRQKARSLALLNGWACTVKIYRDGILEDTNSLDGLIFSSMFALSLTCLLIPKCIVHSSHTIVSLTYIITSSRYCWFLNGIVAHTSPLGRVYTVSLSVCIILHIR